MSKGTCTTIQLLATGVIAFLSEKLGITFYLLGLLVFLMVVDYISGMIASMVEAIDHPGDTSYGWSSSKRNRKEDRIFICDHCGNCN